MGTKKPRSLTTSGFWGWHPNWMHNMVAEVGFEPHDLRVMRSYIELAPVIDVLDRTDVVIAKPALSPLKEPNNV